MKDRIRMCLTETLLLAPFLVSAGVEIDLVRAKVVCANPSSALCRRAVDELERHLLLIAGRRMPEGPFVFSVGERPQGEAEPGPCESRARVCGDRICFWGDDSGEGRDSRKGTLFAVYEFLDRALGVKWVFPGDDGIVFKPQATLRLDDGAAWSYKPVFALNSIRIGRPNRYDEEVNLSGMPEALRPTRDVYERRHAERAQWLERMREVSADRFVYGHAFTDWQDRYLEAHPQWFGMDPRQGLKDRGFRGLPEGLKRRAKFCLSNPEVVDAIVADWRDDKGTCRYFNICPNDGSPGFCRCGSCMELDARRPGEEFLDHLTDRYLWFWNAIADKAVAIRPDVRIVTYAYGFYRHPPRREKVRHPENMVFGMVPAFGDDYVKLYSEWRAVGMRNFFLRPNYLCYSSVFPRGLEKYLYDNFRTSLDYGMMGVDYDGRPRQVTDFEYYVVASLASCPSKGFGDIENEFFSQYGAAADVARAYFLKVRRRAESTRATMMSRVREDNRHMLDDSELSKFAVLGHTQADLDGDLELLRRGVGLGMSDREASRFRRLVLRARHAVLAMRFLAAAKGRDDSAVLSSGRRLYEFRLKNLHALGDEACDWHSPRNCERGAWERYARLGGWRAPAVGGKS